MSNEVFKDPLVEERGYLTKYEGTWLTSLMFPNQERKEDIKNFSIRSDDLFVASFPKSGTTWTQEIVLSIFESTGRHGDIRQGRNLDDIFPFLEFDDYTLEQLTARPSPRLLKTHMPFHLLPRGLQEGAGKIIYVGRNPKDTSVSMFHFFKLLAGMNYKGDYNQFFKRFMDGTVNDGPWLKHMESYWQKTDNKRVLFLMYEDLHMKSNESVQKIAKFLDVKLTDKQVNEIVENSRFDKMKQNDKVNYSWYPDKGIAEKGKEFMRKGKIGDWKNCLTPEMSSEMEEKFYKPLAAQGLNMVD